MASALGLPVTPTQLETIVSALHSLGLLPDEEPAAQPADEAVAGEDDGLDMFGPSNRSES